MLGRLDIKYFKLAVGLDNIGKETTNDIVARCPICGDSKNKSKKRLHLYNKNTVTNVNCFNGDCPCQNKTVYSFLKDFYPNLLGKYKTEQFGNTMEKLASGDSDVFETFKKPETDKTEILTQDLSPYLKDIYDAPEALEYLENRLIHYKESNYGKWFFGYQDLNINGTVYKIKDSIVIPLYFNDLMYGFYSRNIHNKEFATYMNDKNIGFKIWNWFYINKNEPVYIFESIFDAISSGLPNSIAALGAKIPDDKIKELKYPIFVLDNDKTGLLNSLKYLQSGHKVFIQPNIYCGKI